MHGPGFWSRVHDPTSELVLTILSQNSADINAERAFESLRARFPAGPGADTPDETGPDAPDARINRPGWGGSGISASVPPDWWAVETVPLAELVEAIRPGGLAQQKAPRIQAALRHVREERGDHSLEFLGQMEPLAAREWLMRIDGIGAKTASVVLLFSFCMPLMPVDRHVERVSKRIGLLPPKALSDACHACFLVMLRAEQVYAAHVGLITHGRRVCHARRPACGSCLIAPRCRYVDRKAP